MVHIADKAFYDGVLKECYGQERFAPPATVVSENSSPTIRVHHHEHVFDRTGFNGVAGIRVCADTVHTPYVL